MRIGVLAHTEKPGRDRATKHVSKSTAVNWLSLGTHIPIDRKTIQAVDPMLLGQPRKGAAVQTESGSINLAYIPTELPPDIDSRLGVKWQPPTNAPVHNKAAVTANHGFFGVSDETAQGQTSLQAL